MHTSLDALSQRNSKTCLEEWTTEFSRSETQGRNFLAMNTEGSYSNVCKGGHMDVLPGPFHISMRKSH